MQGLQRQLCQQNQLYPPPPPLHSFAFLFYFVCVALSEAIDIYGDWMDFIANPEQHEQ